MLVITHSPPSSLFTDCIGVPTVNPQVDCEFLTGNTGFQAAALISPSMSHKTEAIEGD